MPDTRVVPWPLILILLGIALTVGAGLVITLVLAGSH